ncbi:MAG: cysteine--tRNA ligase [Bacteroidales bacterium]|nr:cysteine--tRNA ligase [Bacteroidales bacterium]
MRELYITNTLSHEKELFKPLTPGHVGLYVCGPTVYGDAHLGHARPGITYDVLTRLLRNLGYKVRYVRNITDVGHLEHDADEGEDKIAKKARLEALEPMEVVQRYTLAYHEAMRSLNVLPPSIEPHASGHIIEQIAIVQKILDAGYAYESNGSIYFDVQKYNKDHHYGVLSGRSLDDTLEGTRNLDGSDDKRAPYDFALWKKALPEHIMRWPSPWSDGFPGWHLECSAMSEKYLGKEFDIHGGGIDLLFPHHECEIAQNVASRGCGGVHYWMHNNMITIEGKKMGKSLGNFITLEELFSGSHALLQQAYSPMTIRFFILQAHYRSTLDFSNEALIAAQKGLKRLEIAASDIYKMAGASAALGVGGASSVACCAGSGVSGGAGASAGSEAVLSDLASKASAEVAAIVNNVYEALCDDLNTPIALSHIYEAVRLINIEKDHKSNLTQADKDCLASLFKNVVEGVLGLQLDSSSSDNSAARVEGLVEMVLEQRQAAKQAKDWATSDAIRNRLASLGIIIKDTKDGTIWNIE